MKYPQEGWFLSWNLSCLKKLWVIMCFSGVLLIKSKMTEQTLLMRSLSIMWNSSSLRQNLRKFHKNLQFEYLILNQYLTIILAKNLKTFQCRYIYPKQYVLHTSLQTDVKRSSFYKRRVFSNTLLNTMGHYWKYVLQVYFMDKAKHMCDWKLWVKSKRHI